MVHHGGAGTTAAGLRAGRPTLVCPLVGDQPFWGRRVAASGAGPSPVPQARLSEDTLVPALASLLSEAVRQGADALGRPMREEPGVAAGVEVVEDALEASTRRPLAFR